MSLALRQPAASQGKLDHWRSERYWLNTEIAADPNNTRKLNGALKGELRQVESFIRFYEELRARAL